jgi:predicted glycogen debranching enzyme
MNGMDFLLDRESCRDFAVSSKKEWLLTNGIGGFAMGTASGAATRRYHGLLVAAVNPPTERMLLVGGLEASVTADGKTHHLSCNQYQGAVFPTGHLLLESFRVGLWAEWEWKIPKGSIVRRVGMVQGENSVTVEHTNLSSSPVLLDLRPLIAHRDYHGCFRWSESYPESVEFHPNRAAIANRGVTLYIAHEGLTRNPGSGWHYRFERQIEVERGLDAIDDLYFPMELSRVLDPGESVHLVFSDQESPTAYEFLDAATEPGLVPLLKQSAQKFFIQAPRRTTILAGYPWFTDWGRDTMISLPGICLALDSWEAGKEILRSYASQMRGGLIPNRFVERGEEPETNTVDATLWMAHAIWSVVQETEDKEFAAEALPWLEEIIERHVQGTLHGIKADEEDGLLTQGGAGLQLTWMDAKIGDWVVTPRTGKAVEINALWINLLRTAEALASMLGQEAPRAKSLAEAAEASFDRSFWRDSLGHYLDVACPDDGTLRPNQVLGMGLPFSPMRGAHAVQALGAVEERLLTPKGLRTLAPNEMGYQGRFEGPMKARDASYHQGTVWPWLLGSYAVAVLRVTGDVERAKSSLASLEEMLMECGLGGISEVYDGDPPQRPGGCPWQSWSMAEAIRALHEIAKAEDPQVA